MDGVWTLNKWSCIIELCLIDTRVGKTHKMKQTHVQGRLMRLARQLQKVWRVEQVDSREQANHAQVAVRGAQRPGRFRRSLSASCGMRASSSLGRRPSGSLTGHERRGAEDADATGRRARLSGEGEGGRGSRGAARSRLRSVDQAAGQTRCVSWYLVPHTAALARPAKCGVAFCSGLGAATLMESFLLCVLLCVLCSLLLLLSSLPS